MLFDQINIPVLAFALNKQTHNNIQQNVLSDMTFVKKVLENYIATELKQKIDKWKSKPPAERKKFKCPKFVVSLYTLFTIHSHTQHTRRMLVAEYLYAITLA